MPSAQQAAAKPTRKVWVQMVTSAITYIALFAFGIELDEEIKAGLSVVVGFVVAYFVPPSPDDQVV